MKKLRLFIAAELSLQLRDSLAEALFLIREKDDKASVVRPQNLHMTLRFIGDVNGITAEDIRLLFQQLKPAGTLCITPGGYRFFRAGTLVLTAEANNQFHRYVESIERGLVNLGLEPEPRTWHPHVTLARRIRRDAVDPGLLPEMPAAEEAMSAAVLFQSEFTDRGMRYTPLATHILTV